MRNEWDERREEGGVWLTPKTFFGHPFPQPTEETEQPTQPTEPTELSDQYFTERGIKPGSQWILPKTMFGHPFPTRQTTPTEEPEQTEEQPVDRTESQEMSTQTPAEEEKEGHPVVIYYHKSHLF